MDEKLNYYNVKYTVLNKGKFYTLGEKIVLGLSEQHAKENFIPNLLHRLQEKQEYTSRCGLNIELELIVRDIKVLNNWILSPLDC